MSRQRVIKKTVYAIGFSLVPLLFIGFIYIFSQPARDSQPIARPTVVPVFDEIIVEQVDVVRSGETVDVVARLRNPNSQVGLAAIDVTFTPDQGGIQKIKSYILPGGLQYVTLLNQPASSIVGQVKVDIEHSDFKELPTGIDLPRFNVFSRDRTQETIGANNLETQRGVVTNTSTVDFQQVEVVALAKNTAGEISGIGRTFVGELAVNEQRDITLQWPTPAAQTSQVTLVAMTNMFAEDAVVKVIGDPGITR